MASSSLQHSLLFRTNLKKFSQPSLPIPTEHLLSVSANSTKLNKLHAVCSLRPVSYLVSDKINGNDLSDPLEEEEEEDPLRIGIIGFEDSGQRIAQGIKRQGHRVLATCESEKIKECCDQNGIEFFKSVDELCEEEPDVVLVCNSILSAEKVIREMPTRKLGPDTIFADALPVKQFPRSLFLEVLPPEFGIVCTHPMFRPESGGEGWDGVPFVYDGVRISHGALQARNCARFLQIFQQEGCRMMEMSCEEHDKHAALSHFIPHTIARILSQLNLEATDIDTKGYEALRKLTENTVSDSYDLYYGLFMYNANTREQMENLERAFEKLKQKLYGRFFDVMKRQLIDRNSTEQVLRGSTERANSTSYFLPDEFSFTSFLRATEVGGTEIISQHQRLMPGKIQ